MSCNREDRIRGFTGFLTERKKRSILNSNFILNSNILNLYSLFSILLLILIVPAHTQALEETKNILTAAAVELSADGTTATTADTAYILINGKYEEVSETGEIQAIHFLDDQLPAAAAKLTNSNNDFNIFRTAYLLLKGKAHPGGSELLAAEAKLMANSQDVSAAATAYLLTNPRIGVAGDIYSLGGISKSFKSIRDQLWLSPGNIAGEVKQSLKYKIDEKSLLSTGGQDLAAANIQEIFNQRGRLVADNYRNYSQPLWVLNDDDAQPNTPAAGGWDNKKPLEGGLWQVDGDLTFNKPAAESGIYLEDKGTIWVKGDLNINTNLSYRTTNGVEALVGFYVEGNVNVAGNVNAANGVYLVNGRFNVLSGETPLAIDGVLAADDFVFGDRRPSNDSQFEIVIRRDSRVNDSPPPGFSQIKWPELKEAAP